MTFGLPLPAILFGHVGISFIAIAAGLVALPALAAGRWLPRTQALFLATTLATSLTGFLFPISAPTPALAVGLISTIDLAIAYTALHAFRLAGRARAIYAITATIGLYLNLFVLVVQSFLKVPALHALAPTGTEPPFVAVQAAVLVASVVLGFAAVRAGRRIGSARN